MSFQRRGRGEVNRIERSEFGGHRLGRLVEDHRVDPQQFERRDEA